jgi:DNA-binding response OmpR family regulator
LADKQRILIVEDDLDLSEMLNAYFRVQGYEVLTAVWGEDAVRVSRDDVPDLVVLDIRLPDIDGYEVCRRLRTNRRTQDIPIIFLTEKRDRVDKLQGLELGVVDYITKPFDIQELRLRVRNALQRAVQQPLINPVTSMAEGVLVDERLNKLMYEEGWAVLSIAIQGLEGFREHYGFVASDDVLRAVSLMMNNAVREVGSEGDFVGHFDQHEFVIVSAREKIDAIRERIEVRIRQSMEYFYPLKDREKARQAMESNTLKLVIGIVRDTDGPFDNLDALKAAITKAQAVVERSPAPPSEQQE